MDVRPYPRGVFDLDPTPPGRKRRKRTPLPSCGRLMHLNGGTQAAVVYAPWKAIKKYSHIATPTPAGAGEVVDVRADDPDAARACITETLEQLRTIDPFPQQTRNNIHKKAPVDGVTLGQIYKFGVNLPSGKRSRVFGDTTATRRYPALYDATVRLARAFDEKAEFTGVQINRCTYECDVHVDRRNFGQSYIIALGSFTHGGRLQYVDRTYDIHNKLMHFHGQLPHRALPHTGGDRYSIVYFTGGDLGGDVQARSEAANFIDICENPRGQLHPTRRHCC